MPIQCLTEECHKSVGSDFRLEAETISDQALAMVSWSLSANVGGSRPTCSGTADESVPLIKHDFHYSDVEFQQMVNVRLFLTAGLTPEMC